MATFISVYVRVFRILQAYKFLCELVTQITITLKSPIYTLFPPASADMMHLLSFEPKARIDSFLNTMQTGLESSRRLEIEREIIMTNTSAARNNQSNKFFKAALVTLAAAIGSAGLISAVDAATISAGGGTWSYGVGKKYVWSYYDHDYRYHSSSVSGQYYVSSGNTAPGYSAQASAPRALWGNQSYYDYK
ncbi:lactococcin 972 family bacteriocin [Lactobacillaceae bacterium L1_55_11]|nr:lactococcin 972 family bacteriocin [Lactobacillaceae bacterium L1_55_11]